ncbi:MAG TPA: CheR family methyltransferase [Kineosporiaceae bacterium]
MSVESTVATERVLTAAEFAWLTDFLRGRTGIELKPGKEPMVMGRLDRRLRHHDLPTYTKYFQLLADGDPLETQLAVDLLTTNETYFFREPKHFDFLREVYSAMPRRPQPVRIWSAASSTGEEAYTVAMTLADCLPAGQAFELLGTDISSRVLETARRAMYPIEAAEKIPARFLREYCLRGRDEFEGFLAIDRRLRERVTFLEANLNDLRGDFGTFDVIFLRNVMIYFGQQTKRDLVARATGMLRPGGYLIISHAETLNGIQGPLRLVRPSVYQLAAAGG